MRSMVLYTVHLLFSLGHVRNALLGKNPRLLVKRQKGGMCPETSLGLTKTGQRDGILALPTADRCPRVLGSLPLPRFRAVSRPQAACVGVRRALRLNLASC